ncbi:MAG: AAA family ATPase, partial [Clostridium sp.]|nr:AAA family ATPase [Clostridium sp.]
MKLHVNNVGVIKEGGIELNGITVIAGQNGLGKSTLGKTLYCLYRTLYDVDNKIHSEILDQVISVLRGNTVTNHFALFRRHMYINSAREVIRKYEETGKISLPEEIKKSVTGSEEKEMLENLQEVLRVPAEDIRSSLFERCIQAEFGGQLTPINRPRAKTDILLEWGETQRVDVRKTKNGTPEIEINGQLKGDALFIDDPYMLEWMTDGYVADAYFDRFSHRSAVIKALERDSSRDSVVGHILAEKAWAELEQLISEMCSGELTES